LHESGRRDDGNFPERVGRQQVGIAGDDQVGPAIDGQFQKLVVMWIAERGDAFDKGDMTGAFGFPTAARRLLIIETRRFELHTPDYPVRRNWLRPKLNEQDTANFGDALVLYQTAAYRKEDTELRMGELKKLSSADRRGIIRYLLRDFPFNPRKAGPIPFRKLQKNLLLFLPTIFLLSEKAKVQNLT